MWMAACRLGHHGWRITGLPDPRSTRTYREESRVGNEEVPPKTKGVAVEVLATVDLAGEIEGMEGRQLRMRMVTIEPGGVFGPIHDHQAGPASSTSCRARSPTVETGSPRTMGREQAGPRIGTRPTGSRTGERSRRWRSRSISSDESDRGIAAEREEPRHVLGPSALDGPAVGVATHAQGRSPSRDSLRLVRDRVARGVACRGMALRLR